MCGPALNTEGTCGSFFLLSAGPHATLPKIAQPASCLTLLQFPLHITAALRNLPSGISAAPLHLAACISATPHRFQLVVGAGHAPPATAKSQNVFIMSAKGGHS